MNRTYAILTLAAALSLGACASDNMAWHDTTYNPGQDNNANMNGDARGTLPDNPQVAGNDKTSMSMSLTQTDRQFIATALAAGQFEVTAANKVQLQSTDQQIKDAARQISEDHMKANSQLTNLASRKGMPTAIGMTGDQINQLSRLDGLNGADFDREYLSQQQRSHEDGVTLFRSAANSANDRDIRDWASATLPTLQAHLDMVKSLNESKFGNGKVGMSQ